jgi:hypothetical protein
MDRSSVFRQLKKETKVQPTMSQESRLEPNGRQNENSTGKK